MLSRSEREQSFDSSVHQGDELDEDVSNLLNHGQQRNAVYTDLFHTHYRANTSQSQELVIPISKEPSAPENLDYSSENQASYLLRLLNTSMDRYASQQSGLVTIKPQSKSLQRQIGHLDSSNRVRATSYHQEQRLQTLAQQQKLVTRLSQYANKHPPAVTDLFDYCKKRSVMAKIAQKYSFGQSALQSKMCNKILSELKVGIQEIAQDVVIKQNGKARLKTLNRSFHRNTEMGGIHYTKFGIQKEEQEQLLPFQSRQFRDFYQRNYIYKPFNNEGTPKVDKGKSKVLEHKNKYYHYYNQASRKAIENFKSSSVNLRSTTSYEAGLPQALPIQRQSPFSDLPQERKILKLLGFPRKKYLEEHKSTSVAL